MLRNGESTLIVDLYTRIKRSVRVELIIFKNLQVRTYYVDIYKTKLDNK